ncbi:Alpha-glucan phosphorylase, H isozyme [Hibiscus syriacus]|uniref:Alpha-1,4 glucan phosphorylase n=1 Tax=Hibiscus syriacus TaxID=106335 RepID=A0A6A2XTC4_HIBSY|nr:Alpha-glucan phosphorylase, H isozyme [Hibiscus syriacus]
MAENGKSSTEKVPAAAHPLTENPTEIATDINYHVKLNTHFSPFKFEPEQAFFATAESVRNSMGGHFLYFVRDNPKHTYYFSMEFLQGRALTNAIGNLGIENAYAEALNKLGHELEEIVEQVINSSKKPVLVLNCIILMTGNGGLGRIASCFLDSMATLNLPAGGYGLRYKYGLFKQRNTKQGQEEIAEDWLEFSPWEVVRYDLVYPVRFFIYAVLYPGDATESGKLLRLKQQFFLCSASLQDIISRFKDQRGGYTWSEFPSKIAVQLNDTHPTLAIPELMCLPMEDEGLGWDEAWDVTTRTIAYTNHTVLPEALEKWSQPVMWKLLPCHMEIIEEIDIMFLAMVKDTRPDLEYKLPSMCILDHNPPKPVVRMANLCVVSAHTVNGVAQLHSYTLKAELFVVTSLYGPPSSKIRLTALLGGFGFAIQSSFADDANFQDEWASAKMASKRRLASNISCVTGESIDPNSLYDIQVKRIHEYKRQLLNILGAIDRWYLFQNYNVSVAEMLIPGSELSQHISTAGMEASGTSNMKFALNGCLIIGTLDGANVEIREEIGEEIFFLFGARADEVPRLRKYQENRLFEPDPRFEEAKQYIRSGAFGSYDYKPLLDSLEDVIYRYFRDRKRWLKMSILSTVGCGKFISDQTIAQYAKEIWNIQECRVP